MRFNFFNRVCHIIVLLFVAYSLTGCYEIEIEHLDAVNDFPEMSCDKYTIPVKLNPNDSAIYKVVSTLCWEGELEGKTTQVLLSGGGYGPIYWDFPYEADTYSYVRAAVREGYATFNLSRIGIGESSHPFGMSVDIDTNAYVIHQTIESCLGEGNVSGVEFGPIVTVGHSMGSVMAIAHATTYPQDLDGMILTGFLHNSNPEYIDSIMSNSTLALFDSRFKGEIVDPTYLTSKPGKREAMFYNEDNSDENVIAVDEENGETLTIGETASMSVYYGPVSIEIQIPVMELTGEDDFVGCGGDLDCYDHSAVIAHEQQFFSEAACVETNIIENTGHVTNLHYSAPLSYQIMLDWIAKRVGVNTNTGPTYPCL